MKFNYITLCIFILIIILCCVTMLYQHQQKIQRYDIQNNKATNPKLFQLHNSPNKNKKDKKGKVIESFNSDKLVPGEMIKRWETEFKTSKKLFLTDIKIIEDNGRKIVLQGKNLDKIITIFFGEIVGTIEEVTPGVKVKDIKITDKDGKTINLQEMKIIPPNLNDDRFKGFNKLDSLEMKFLIKDGNDKSTDPNEDKNIKIAIRSPEEKQLNIEDLGIKNEFLKRGYSKQVLISFELKYFIPTKQYEIIAADGKKNKKNKLEISPNYYDNTKLNTYEPGDERNRNQAANQAEEAIFKLKYIHPEKRKCVKSYQLLCQEVKSKNPALKEKFKNRPDLQSLCKDYEQFKTTTEEAKICSKYIQKGDKTKKKAEIDGFPEKPPIQIKFNNEVYTLKEGQNTIFLTITKDNSPDEAIRGDGNNKHISVNLSEKDRKIFNIENKLVGQIEEEAPVTLSNVIVKQRNENTQVLIPSGLYYKPGIDRMTTDAKGIKFDTKSWSLELGRKIDTQSGIGTRKSDGGQMVNSITGFYTNTKEVIEGRKKPSTGQVTLNPIDKALKESWEKNGNPKPNAKTRELEFKWDTPEQFLYEPNLDKYKYYLIFELDESIEEQNSNVITDDLKEKILEIPVLKQQDPNKMKSFKKEFNTMMSFSYDRLKPRAKYKYTFWLITNSLDGNMKIIEQEYIFKTPEMLQNKYHSHLFDPVTKKFKLEMINFDLIKDKEPELVQTYYQMLAYNKRKNEDDILNSQIDMQESNQCMKANINQFKFGEIGTTFSKNLTKFITEENLKDGTEFSIKQEKQEKQIADIQKKLEEIEEHQGRKVTLQDLQIKTLKSLQDGSLIRLEELAGEKKLVKLNDGCLAYNKKLQFGGNDDYGYIPCNSLDLEQHFKINKINNLDEYNFLLSSNLSPRITEDEDQNRYPFYTLQPDNSEKCVAISDSKLRILPCSDNKSIKYQGFFAKDECNV